MSIFRGVTRSISELVDWSYQDFQTVAAAVTGFEYRWINGVAIPMVLFRDDVSDGAFPLVGRHYLTFSQEQYCPWCLMEVRPNTLLCDDCEDSELSKRLRCIHEGSGVPFGTDCDPEKPACELEHWAKAVCYSPWMVYVASVCGVTKVGISRMRKDGCDLGFTKRLISQGATSWIALGPAGNLDMALSVESRLSQSLSIPTLVTTDQKVEWMLDGCESSFLPMHEISEWCEAEGIKTFLYGDFTDAFLLDVDGLDVRYESRPIVFQGDLQFSIGPLIGLAYDDSITLTSIEKNRGRGLLGAI